MSQLNNADRPEISILHTPHGIFVQAKGWLAVTLVAVVVILALVPLVEH